MKNKIRLKKYLFCTLITSIAILICSLVINIYEYNVYNRNTNYKIAEIVSAIKKEYPNVSESDILNILKNENFEIEIFEKYSYDINKDTIVKVNNKEHIKFIIINSILLLISLLILVLIFLKYNSKKDKEINDITKCIEEINKKNYKLNIDDMSEDELSILKNEIYKTTLMLKEEADNSTKEKLELKDSLSDISHQLKTPLTSILIILDDLIDDPDMDKDTRESFIKDIKREIININFLVQSLLKLSKLDTNSIEFVQEEVSIKQIIKEVEQNLASLSDLKNIPIKVLFKDNPNIICDYKWQVEAITNIVKNCIEYSSENNPVKILVEDNKVYTKIVISDIGKEIDKEDIKHIFERFYKGKNSTNESIGIGLSLAKSIINKDNGTIGVESKNDKTSFTIKYYKNK